MKHLFLFFKLQVFIATQGVGTHHNVLVLITKSEATTNYCCTRIYHYTYRQFHCINVRRIEDCIFLCDVSFAVQYTSCIMTHVNYTMLSLYSFYFQ